jgi:hypothetical protein
MDTTSTSSDAFTVTFGADVDYRSDSLLKDLGRGDSGGKEMDIDSEVQDASISSSASASASASAGEEMAASSHSLPMPSQPLNADDRNESVKALSSTNLNLNLNLNNDASSSDAPVVVISSADVTSWSHTQQDFSELLFLANNANNTAYVESSVGVGIGADREKKEDLNVIVKNETAGRSKEENVKKGEKGEIGEKGEEVKKEEMEKYKDRTKEKEKEKEKERRQVVPLLLEMTEPNPETPRGMDLWLLWFDGLKHSSDTLQSFL